MARYWIDLSFIWYEYLPHDWHGDLPYERYERCQNELEKLNLTICEFGSIMVEAYNLNDAKRIVALMREIIKKHFSGSDLLNYLLEEVDIIKGAGMTWEGKIVGKETIEVPIEEG